MTLSQSKYLRIPRWVRLPFGYTVRVEQITLAELKKRCQEDVWGYWDDTTRTVYIAKNAPIGKKRYALLHELKHAFADWEHLHFELGVVKP